MIQKMNGSIGVDSQIGKGSAFWFTLRAASTESAS
jgi:signal transduction histidine kinase